MEQVTEEDVLSVVSKVVPDAEINTASAVHSHTLGGSDLRDAGRIEDTTSRATEIVIFSEKERIVAEATYEVFLTENVGYISDLEVDSEFQENGIGTILRSHVISEIDKCGCNVIYSLPINDIIESIVADQKFKRVESPTDWFRRELEDD